jgi:hypothetical protein
MFLRGLGDGGVRMRERQMFENGMGESVSRVHSCLVKRLKSAVGHARTTFPGGCLLGDDGFVGNERMEREYGRVLSCARCVAPEVRGYRLRENGD